MNRRRPRRTGKSGAGYTPGKLDVQVIAGRQPVLEALRHGMVLSIEISATARGPVIAEIERAAMNSGIPVSRTGDWTTQEGARDQGVRARIRPVVPRHDLLKFVESLPSSPPPLLLMLDGVEDPHNLGAILRSAYGAAVDAVILRSRRQAPITETVFRTSAGAVALVPLFEANNLDHCLRELSERGYWSAVADRMPEAERYDRFDWKRPTLLIVGAEGKGVSPLLKKRADLAVQIPMYRELDSLNVSVATAILLFEAARQRDPDSNSSLERS